MTLGDVMGSVGRGLAAGAVGTGVMTVFQMIEMRMEERGQSRTPAQAIERVLDIQPRSERAEERLTNIVHFGYGTAWGGIRGLLGAMGLPAAVATPAHALLVSGAAAATLPRLDLAPPVREWGKKQVAMDLLRHGVYALATGLAYEWLERRAHT